MRAPLVRPLAPNAAVQQRIAGKLRGNAAQEAGQSFTIDLNTFLEGKDASQNIMVADGDSIYVPESLF